MTNGESEQQVPQRPRSAQPAEATMRKIVRRRAETNKARRNNNPNRKNERERRELGGSQSEDEEFYSEYFEDYDADGDAYSLAWRYLGVYIDTEDDDAPYSRKVLWAAVRFINTYTCGNKISNENIGWMCCVKLLSLRGRVYTLPFESFDLCTLSLNLITSRIIP